MKLTGDQIRILLNQQWATSTPRIMQISRLRYTWSTELPSGQRILDIFLPNGKKIEPKAEYSLTVNNSMANGGDGFVILETREGSLNLDAFGATTCFSSNRRQNLFCEREPS